MEESYLYYPFKTDDYYVIDGREVLRLGNLLLESENFLEDKYTSFISEFGFDFVNHSPLSLRFWTTDKINESSFYETLFKKVGYFDEAEVSKFTNGLLCNILEKNMVPFKERGFWRKKLTIFKA